MTDVASTQEDTTILGGESLTVALDRVYAALTAGQQESTTAAAVAPGVTAPGHEPSGAALQELVAVFDLSAFERDTLLLCAGASLESRFLSACAASHGLAHATWPTFGLALSALKDPHWTAVSRLGPLRYWRLVEIGSGPLLHAPLTVDERILQFLLGVPGVDERLEAVIRPIPFDRRARRSTLPPSAVADALGHWQRSAPTQDPILLMGDHSSARQAAFVELCEAGGCLPYAVHMHDLPATAAERVQLARLWTREAALSRAALYVRTDHLPGEPGPASRNLTAWLPLVRARVAVEVQSGTSGESLAGLRIQIRGLSSEERKATWRAQLGPAAQQMNGALDRIADYFHFDETAIQFSAASAVETARTTDEDLGKVAWHTCRQYSRRALDNLAHRIEPRASWHDLVLPAPQTEALRQIAVHLRQRAVVNEQWGFSARYSRGLGLSALFAGASGTGKTLAAELLAGELDLDLYQIDLATIVSKYIGETEKNLRQIFDAAEQSGAVLLFDEADALFGKRSEVKDSHDRYANLEVSYLLQRMDSYRGVALLTTNLQHAIDPAFLRRIRFVVQFPFPDAAARARIWQNIFPKNTPVGALDFPRLAQLNVSGGVIRNIAMHAAFMAAEEHGRVELGHILAAARIEYAKLDRPVTSAEMKGWAS